MKFCAIANCVATKSKWNMRRDDHSKTRSQTTRRRREHVLPRRNVSANTNVLTRFGLYRCHRCVPNRNSLPVSTIDISRLFASSSAVLIEPNVRVSPKAFRTAEFDIK
jgi:hypothetical protein